MSSKKCILTLSNALVSINSTLRIWKNSLQSFSDSMWDSGGAPRRGDRGKKQYKELLRRKNRNIYYFPVTGFRKTFIWVLIFHVFKRHPERSYCSIWYNLYHLVQPKDICSDERGTTIVLTGWFDVSCLDPCHPVGVLLWSPTWNLKMTVNSLYAYRWSMTCSWLYFFLPEKIYKPLLFSIE